MRGRIVSAAVAFTQLRAGAPACSRELVLAVRRTTRRGMSNRSFNELVVPLLQPDPKKPGSTVDPHESSRTAIDPNRRSPETGFDIGGRPADGSRVVETMIDGGDSP
jgi:hypothetical protein